MMVAASAEGADDGAARGHFQRHAAFVSQSIGSPPRTDARVQILSFDC